MLVAVRKARYEVAKAGGLRERRVAFPVAQFGVRRKRTRLLRMGKTEEHVSSRVYGWNGEKVYLDRGYQERHFNAGRCICVSASISETPPRPPSSALGGIIVAREPAEGNRRESFMIGGILAMCTTARRCRH